MALVLRTIYNRYYYYLEELHDPRVNDYPLVHSPVPILTIIGLYLLFVLKWGPEFMRDRKPYDLRNIIRVYNIYQVIFNFIIATYMLYSSYLQSDFSLRCQVHDPTNTKPHMTRLIFATYLCYLNKILDLLDTVFFILRKKDKQVTFLHVYHHALVAFSFYIFTKCAAGSHSTLLAIINSYIHVTMYGYYYLSSIEGNSTKYTWCKKYITQLQLLQFGVLVIHYIIPLLQDDCKHPLFVTLTGIIQNSFMFAMFADFYVKAYVLKKDIKPS